MGNKRKELNARLGDYAASARLATAATTLRGRLGNWPIYAAAVGSALAMSTNASANIITGQLSGATVSPTGVNKSSIKGLLFLGEINLKASAGILTSSGNPLGPFAALNVSAVGPTAFVFDTSAHQQQAINFAQSAIIGPGAGHKDPIAAIVAATFSNVKYGQFASNVPGFVGLAFSLGGGHFDYGWLEVEFQNVDGAPNTLEALAFGVNTSEDQAIKAGTPEPGTMGLALLATGAFGVAALRRRKKLQPEPAA